MNLNIDKSFMTGILSSLAVLYFFDPILTSIGNFLLYIGNTFANNYLDTIYSETASGDINYGFLIIMLPLSFILLSYISIAIIKIFDYFKKDIPLPGDSLTKKISFQLFLGIFVMFLCALAIGDGYLRLKISTTFKQHLTILAPNITDQQYKIFNAEYSSMRNQSDYQNLRLKMEDTARKLGIVLPKNKLYP